MPVKPSGMQTSRGIREESSGAGRAGHGGVPWARPRVGVWPMATATAIASNTPEIERPRVNNLGRDYNPRMVTISRRRFGSMLAAGVPLAGLTRAIRAASPKLLLGVTSSSFRDFPRVEGQDNLDAVIRALQTVSANHIELAFANVEPAPPSVAPFMGGSNAYPRRVVLTPEQIAATNADARKTLRTWRLQAGADFFEEARRKIAAGGLTVHGCSIPWDASFSDEEIDATFRQARLLGVSTISSPLSMTTAERLVSFAERHRVAVAIHNQADGNPRGDIDMPQLARALAMSPMFRVRLDIGNLTASNGDAVAELRKYRSRLSYVIVRDRLRNGGASQPFGEGDTPIREVLAVLAESESPLPALVEYDYVGLRTPMDEVKASLAYLRDARQPER